jgi:hypothetical protein
VFGIAFNAALVPESHRHRSPSEAAGPTSSRNHPSATPPPPAPTIIAAIKSP